MGIKHIKELSVMLLNFEHYVVCVGFFFSLMLLVGLLSALEGKNDNLEFAIAKSLPGLCGLFAFAAFWWVYRLSWRTLTLGGILRLDRVTGLKDGHRFLLSPLCWKRFLMFLCSGFKSVCLVLHWKLASHSLKLCCCYPGRFAFRVNVM